MKPLDYQVIHITKGADFGHQVEVKDRISLFYLDKTVIFVAEKKINKLKWTFSIKCEKVEKNNRGIMTIEEQYTMTIVNENSLATNPPFKDRASSLPKALDVLKERCRRLCRLGHL